MNEHGFLYQIAKTYVEHEADRLDRILFVFPTRRSSVFFRKYIGICSSAPRFCPPMMTVDELFASLSTLKSADKIEQLYILYTEYKDIMGEKAETFDRFVYWGEVLVGDFSDVDKYLADADKIFANIKDLRELDSGYEFLSPAQREAISRFWGVYLEGGTDTRNKEQFIGTWKILAPLYHRFRSALEAKGIGYGGMIYRQVAQMCATHEGQEHIKERCSCYSKIVFIGLNALSTCEKELFNFIRDNLSGSFYWDYYGDIVCDPQNRASAFIRNYIDRYPSEYQIDATTDTAPEIEVVSVPSSVGQTKVAGECLLGCDMESAVVVLPDEKLLPPLLNSLPEQIQSINVTMGRSLDGSSFSTLMHLFSTLALGRQEKNGRMCFYHKDVTAILKHPFIRAYDPERSRAAVERIVSHNQVYVECGSIEIGPFFRNVSTTEEAIAWQIDIIETLAPILSPVEKEFAHGYYKAVCHIRDLHIEMEMATCFRFLWQLTARLSVALQGEPLCGLQVMGPLETRVIDFDTVIMLSMNEGTFPARSTANSFIPYNLRIGFGLPTAEDLDAITAYHFFRSIYRAKRVVLIYDSRTEGLRSGEESRFIKQLRYQYNHPIKDIVRSYSVNPVSNSSDFIAKDEQLLDKIERLFIRERKPFSASSLNKLIDCPMKFYFENILGLSREDEVKENIEADLMGTIFHDVMMNIYTPLIGKQLQADDIKAIRKDRSRIDSLILGEIDSKLHLEGRPAAGKLIISVEIIKRLVDKTLEADIARGGITVEACEKKVAMPFNIGTEENPRIVRLFGIIDRIDRTPEGRWLVIDYKTGASTDVSGSPDPDRLPDIFDAGRSNRPYTALQMLMYAYMHQQTAGADGNSIDYQIYSLSQLFAGKSDVKQCSGEILSRFAELLAGKTAELFDPAVPIRAIKNRKCSYCDVKNLCPLQL